MSTARVASGGAGFVECCGSHKSAARGRQGDAEPDDIKGVHMEKKIVIIGAGPTGLGAAYRLKELGYKNFQLYDRHPYIGGLASSFTDSAGFTWDIGGHVMFSHYK